MIELSILVCSTHTRYNTFAPRIQEQLYGQLTPENSDHVEILMLTDNKTIMLGEKRNMLVEIAQGNYVVFVDDDDRIAPDYIDTLLQAIRDHPGIDAVTFLAEVSLNGGRPKICRYSALYKSDYNTSTEYHRLPNHICCIRRDHALAVKFPNIPYGEDSGWSKELHPRLVHEAQIDRVLYYYDYNASTSETQEHKPERNRRPVRPVGPVLDLVILSNAKSAALHTMTSECIDSIRQTTLRHQVNVIVMEQSPRYSSYPGADKVILCREPFHYNKFANRGLRTGSARWVMVANNDLLFENGWLAELLGAGWPVVSPKCPDDERQKHITEPTSGWQNGVHFSGWCFMMTREKYNEIGGFDECVSFWCSDDVVLEQLKECIEPSAPVLVPDARVRHLGSTTLKTATADEYTDLTWAQVHAFNEHHGQEKFAGHPKFIKWKVKNGYART